MTMSTFHYQRRMAEQTNSYTVLITILIYSKRIRQDTIKVAANQRTYLHIHMQRTTVLR
jgi:hypothetical protein